VYVCMKACLCVCVHESLLVCMFAWKLACVYVCMKACLCVCVHESLLVCVCAWKLAWAFGPTREMYMFLCFCICMHVHEAQRRNHRAYPKAVSTRARVCVYVATLVCVSGRKLTSSHVHTTCKHHLYVCAYVYVCIHAYMRHARIICMYKCICVCIYMFVCVWRQKLQVSGFTHGMTPITSRNNYEEIWLFECETV
jgi:hypothetical protein